MNGHGAFSLNPQAFQGGLNMHPGGINLQKPHSHGFCHSCCHPVSKCCCGVRECRKIAKELLANALEGKLGNDKKIDVAKHMASMSSLFLNEPAKTPVSEVGAEAVHSFAAAAAASKADLAGAIIGGGCCVHISIEYMPSQPAAKLPSYILAMVQDSEGTVLAWGKDNVPSGYHIKEGIITTKPGAQVKLLVINAIARLRWCEVFSC